MVLLRKLPFWILGGKTGLVDWLMWPRTNTAPWWRCIQYNTVAKMNLASRKVKKVKVVSDSLRPHGLYSGQNAGVGSLSLLQGIFPTQGSKPGLPRCRQILYQLCLKGSPFWNKTIKSPSVFPFCSLSFVIYIVVFFSHLLYLEEIYCNGNRELALALDRLAFDLEQNPPLALWPLLTSS